MTGTLDQDPFTGKVSKDGRPYLGDAAFKMKQQSWGVVATQVDDPENIVSFRRQQAGWRSSPARSSSLPVSRRSS